jgi:hypothetical protein
LHAAYLCNLVPQPDLDLRAECFKSASPRLRGSRIGAAPEEHGEERTAGEVQLLAHRKTLKHFEDVVAPALDGLGKEFVDGG